MIFLTFIVIVLLSQQLKINEKQFQELVNEDSSQINEIELCSSQYDDIDTLIVDKDFQLKSNLLLYCKKRKRQLIIKSDEVHRQLMNEKIIIISGFKDIEIVNITLYALYLRITARREILFNNVKIIRPEKQIYHNLGLSLEINLQKKSKKYSEKVKNIFTSENMKQILQIDQKYWNFINRALNSTQPMSLLLQAELIQLNNISIQSINSITRNTINNITKNYRKINKNKFMKLNINQEAYKYESFMVLISSVEININNIIIDRCAVNSQQEDEFKIASLILYFAKYINIKNLTLKNSFIIQANFIIQKSFANLKFFQNTISNNTFYMGFLYKNVYDQNTGFEISKVDQQDQYKSKIHFNQFYFYQNFINFGNYQERLLLNMYLNNQISPFISIYDTETVEIEQFYSINNTFSYSPVITFIECKQVSYAYVKNLNFEQNINNIDTFIILQVKYSFALKFEKITIKYNKREIEKIIIQQQNVKNILGILEKLYNSHDTAAKQAEDFQQIDINQYFKDVLKKLQHFQFNFLILQVIDTIEIKINNNFFDSYIKIQHYQFFSLNYEPLIFIFNVTKINSNKDQQPYSSFFIQYLGKQPVLSIKNVIIQDFSIIGESLFNIEVIGGNIQNFGQFQFSNIFIQKIVFQIVQEDNVVTVIHIKEDMKSKMIFTNAQAQNIQFIKSKLGLQYLLLIILEKQTYSAAYMIITIKQIEIKNVFFQKLTTVNQQPLLLLVDQEVIISNITLTHFNWNSQIIRSQDFGIISAYSLQLSIENLLFQYVKTIKSAILYNVQTTQNITCINIQTRCVKNDYVFQEHGGLFQFIFQNLTFNLYKAIFSNIQYSRFGTIIVLESQNSQNNASLSIKYLLISDINFNNFNEIQSQFGFLISQNFYINSLQVNNFSIDIENMTILYSQTYFIPQLLFLNSFQGYINIIMRKCLFDSLNTFNSSFIQLSGINQLEIKQVLMKYIKSINQFSLFQLEHQTNSMNFINLYQICIIGKIQKQENFGTLINISSQIILSNTLQIQMSLIQIYNIENITPISIAHSHVYLNKILFVQITQKLTFYALMKISNSDILINSLIVRSVLGNQSTNDTLNNNFYCLYIYNSLINLQDSHFESIKGGILYIQEDFNIKQQFIYNISYVEAQAKNQFNFNYLLSIKQKDIPKELINDQLSVSYFPQIILTKVDQENKSLQKFMSQMSDLNEKSINLTETQKGQTYQIIWILYYQDINSEYQICQQYYQPKINIEVKVDEKEETYYMEEYNNPQSQCKEYLFEFSQHQQSEQLRIQILNQPYYNNKLQNYTFYIKIINKQCKIGYYLSTNSDENQKCSKCENGYYNYNPNGQVCKKCPYEVINCKNGIIQQLKEGYWRSNYYSDIIEKCINNIKNCLQEKEDICKEGTFGPLCEICDYYGRKYETQYFNIAEFQCEKCSKLKFEILNRIIRIVILLIIIIYSFYISYNGIEMSILVIYLKKIELVFLGISGMVFLTSSFTKIIIVHYQFLGLLNQYEVNEKLKELLQIQEYFDIKISIFTTTFDCLIISSDLEMQSIRLLFILTIPIVILFFLILSYTIYAKMKQKKITSTILIFFIVNIYYFFIQGIIRELINFITCRKIGQNLYLKSNTNIICYGKEHQQMLLFYVLPFKIFYLILLPLITLFMVKKNKNQLKRILIMFKYGVLYLEYKSKNYLFEFIKLIFKYFVIFFVNMFNYSPSLISQITIILFLLCQMITNYLKPFQYKNLDKFDILSNIIIIFSFFFVSLNQINDGLATLIIIYAVIVILNVIFISKGLINLIFLFLIQFDDILYPYLKKVKFKIPYFLQSKRQSRAKLVRRLWKLVQTKLMK